MTDPALEASIQNWIHNRDNPSTATFGSKNCALCQQHRRGFPIQFDPEETDCHTCPVAQRTGQNCCIGSPYVTAVVVHDDWLEEPNPDTLAAWTAAAQAEIDFLISLRKDPTT
jgi:hypothetical protein